MATAEQIRQELQSGPQTQEALDAALLKYSPAQMAAAFPEFGGPAQYEAARQEAAARVQPKIDFITGGSGPRNEAEYQRMVAEKAAIDAAARQKLDNYQPTGYSVYGDLYYRAQQDPSLLRKQYGESDADALRRLKYNVMEAEERVVRRSGGSPNLINFDDPLARQTAGFVSSNAPAPAPAPAGSPFVIGGQNAPTGQAVPTNQQSTPTGQAVPTNQQIADAIRRQTGGAFTNLNPIGQNFAPQAAARQQAIRDWYNANVGRGTQADLDRWLATSGYTAQEINAALPQWGVADLEREISRARQQYGGPTAPRPATPAAQIPTAPAAAQDRIQAIRDWWAANEGRGTQADLNRFLATSGYSAREINQALPQLGYVDLQNAIRTAINEVAQQTPFAPAVPRSINQPYTSIAGQLSGAPETPEARRQAILNWYAANEGSGDQAALDRFLASGYTAQEISQALPQWGEADLEREIARARQAFPTASYEAALDRYQRGFQPGRQYVGGVSPYSLVTQQMQQFQNPYADTLANISLGGYTPSLYDVLLQDVVETGSGGNVSDSAYDGIGGDDGTGGGGGDTGGGDTGDGGGGMSNSGEGGPDGVGGWAKGGLVDYVTGPNPPGPDDGIGMLQVGEYVIKKSSVKKYGKGLLDMINEGKIPAKKIKSLLD